MKTRTAIMVVAAFVGVHFCAWLFFFYIDLWSANGVMHRYFVEVRGSPRDWRDIGRLISSFPIGPFSCLLWGAVLYGILKIFSWAARPGNEPLAEQIEAPNERQ